MLAAARPGDDQPAQRRVARCACEVLLVCPHQVEHALSGLELAHGQNERLALPWGLVVGVGAQVHHADAAARHAVDLLHVAGAGLGGGHHQPRALRGALAHERRPPAEPAGVLIGHALEGQVLNHHGHGGVAAKGAPVHGCVDQCGVLAPGHRRQAEREPQHVDHQVAHRGQLVPARQRRRALGEHHLHVGGRVHQQGRAGLVDHSRDSRAALARKAAVNKHHGLGRRRGHVPSTSW